MFCSGELCDLTVVCQETHRSYRVHALVMLSMSGLFMEFMDHQDNQDDWPGPTDDVRRLRLPLKEKTIEALIKTAYEGAESVSFDVEDHEGLKDLIGASISFQISLLKKQVASLMVSACSPTNMVDLLETANIFSDDEVFQQTKATITIFMAKNIGYIIASQAFLSFSKEEMIELLGSRHLQLTKEEAQQFLLSWLQGNTVRNTTRLLRTTLSQLAGRPTTYRIPASVILAAGGWAPEPTSLVEVFNELDRSWAVSSFKLPGSSRAYHGMEVEDSNIWVVGGYNQQHGFLRSLYHYQLPAGPWVQKSSMSTPRCYPETQLLDGQIFAIGGHSGGSGERLRSGEVYTIATNQWKGIADMVHPRSDFASVVLHGDIYVMGGCQEISIEKYSVAEDRWTVVGHLAEPRSGCSAVVANGKIFVFGGKNGSERLATVESFSPRLAGLVSLQNVPDMIHSRSNFSALLVDHKTIMVRQSIILFYALVLQPIFKGCWWLQEGS